MPEGSDEATLLAARQNHSGGPVRFSVTIVEEDGVRYLQNTQTYEVCFRIHDGMLYESNLEELFEMQLPTSQSLVGGVDGTNDLGLTLFFERIPVGLRQLAWNVLNSGVGVQLQQRDEEPDQVYEARRSIGDLALPLVHAVLFDIDKAEGWIRMVSQDQPAIRGQLAFHTRTGSALSKLLLDLASGRSRFAPILNDGAAVTVHACVQLPPEGKRVFQALSRLLLMEAENTQAEMRDPLKSLAGAVALLSEHNCAELLLKLGWTEASDGVIYGGIQIGDQPDLLTVLHQLLTRAPNAPADVQDLVTLTRISGRTSLRFRIPMEDVAQLKAVTSLSLTHVYLMQEQGCLWFAAGGENANEMLRQCLVTTEQSGLASTTPLLTAHLDGERWLSYPQDDPTGVGGLLLWLDQHMAGFPPGIGPFGVFDGGPPLPLIERVRSLGGNEELRLVVTADRSGLLLDARVGQAIGNYYLARMVATQDSVRRRALQSAEETKRTITSESPAPPSDSTPRPLPDVP